MGMICVEMPEVRFEDILTMPIPNDTVGLVPIDPLFLGACEEGSIKVVGLVPSEPVVLGAYVSGSSVFVVREERSQVDGYITIRISGIRKGRNGVRFPRFTEEEFEKNTRFWSGWNR